MEGGVRMSKLLKNGGKALGIIGVIAFSALGTIIGDRMQQNDIKRAVSEEFDKREQEDEETE